MYLFNYLDRNALVNARLNDLEDEIGLVGTQYNTCVSILFVGYVQGSNRKLSSASLRSVC